ncbi:MAG: hypothetical protein JOZ38_07455 [Candidatus Eremiobacteraeota bacterium]|nr:hypothetical protein [Candidatus Eremiobacteraeota bacterium]
MAELHRCPSIHPRRARHRHLRLPASRVDRDDQRFGERTLMYAVIFFGIAEIVAFIELCNHFLERL